MARIAILDCTKTPYSGETLRSEPLGGIQSCTINLAEGFAKQGHHLEVFNSIDKTSHEYGVIWHPLHDNIQNDFDLVIANNDPCLFYNLQPSQQKKNYVVWLHNPIKLLKFIKTGRLKAVLQLKPKAVFLGKYHQSTCSPLIPFKARYIIPHGIDEIYFDEAGETLPRLKRAIFTAQPYRGLKEITIFWKNYIYPLFPDAQLHAFCGNNTDLQNADLNQYGIFLNPRIPKQALIQEMKSAMVLPYWGHQDETFCLSAVEAMACGLPVVTQGIGALKERVIHNHNGFEAQSDSDLQSYISQIFTNPDVFTRLSLNARESATQIRWDRSINEWSKRFLSL